MAARSSAQVTRHSGVMGLAGTIVPPRAVTLRALREGVQRELRFDPARTRMDARCRFYLSHGAGSRHGFGRSELSFLAWQLRRGTFGGDARPLSRWWSGVNTDLAVHSELAAAVRREGLESHPDVPAEVLPWLRYLSKPSALTWYRAHNASVVRSYLARAAEAQQECAAEQRFLGQVLVRLLCVQAVIEHETICSPLARVLDPRGGFVAAVVRFPLLYPGSYPVDPRSVCERTRRVLALAEQALWRPGLGALFRAAALWLELPEMTALVANGRLLYPNSEPTPAAAALAPLTFGEVGA